MRYVINLLAALGLFYSGFVNTFWGNDPYLGWAITIIAAFIMAEPLLAVMERLGMRSLGPNRLYYQGEAGEVFVAYRAHWTPPESALRTLQQKGGASHWKE